VPAAPESELYVKHEVDGIDVYLHLPVMKKTEELSFAIAGVWIFKRVIAVGLNLRF
jgi:hypothetical protein